MCTVNAGDSQAISRVQCALGLSGVSTNVKFFILQYVVKSCNILHV